MNPITMKLVVDDLILQALREDITFEDVSTASVCPTARPATVELIAKADGIIAGLDVFARTFELLDSQSSVLFDVADGDEVHAGDHVGQVRGDARVLLSGERVALNYLQRMSGIATYTHQMAAALEGTKTVLVDTRKTTPGMRVFEKAAVEIGGGSNHRYNLSTAVMLKDNHIDAAGGVARAIEMARAHASFTTTVEIECENLDMVREAVEAGADIIMFDNMTHDDMTAAIELIAGRAKTECSGNVDASNIRALADLGVDYLWLTPFFPSPQRDNGYDVADYCAIDPRYGTMEDLEELIREADKRGIGLMLDMVFNHTSTEHAWFQRALAGEKKYQDYYIFKNGTPDNLPTNWVSKFGGPAWQYVPQLGKWYLHLYDVMQADLNWENPAVREEMADILRFWKAKGIKGFRFDVINVISKPEFYEDDYEGDGRRFYTDGRNVHKYLKELVAAGGIDGMITVGEMSSTTLENCIGYTAEGNHELTMCFNFHHLKVDYKDGQKWELMEPDYLAMKKLFQTWQEGMQAHGGWNALFWCNHDQPRAVSRFGSDGKYWKQSAEMLAAAIHFMRGTPYIYQGEELGMTNPHFTSIDQYRDVESRNYYKILRQQDKSEEETLDIIAQRSRDDSRTPMQWDASENAGFTTSTPWIGIADNYKAINAAAQMDAPDSIRSFYKTLVALRKKMPVISAGKIEFLYPDNADLLAYRRYDGETELLVLCNLREREIAKPLPVGWTDAEKLLGNYPDNADTLRPYECVVLKK